MHKPQLHDFRHELQNCDFAISPLGLGTVKLGRNQGVRYPQAFVIPDDDDAMALLQLARELGINLLDTAPAYGNSEERLGKLLRGQRREWIICSKAGEEFVDGESSFNFTPEHIQHSVKRSLQRLQTDYLDIVLIHSDGNDLDIIKHWGAIEVLNELKQQGWIRASGMSTKTVEGGLAAAAQGDVVMATLNLDYAEERPVFEYCAGQHKTTLVKKAFASGHICEHAQQGEDPIERSLKFIFATPGVSAVIAGTINPGHLTHNAAALEQVLMALR